MVDNVTLPATGSSVAADEIGGVLYQRVKNTFGADGTATDVSAAAPMPVTIDGGALLTVLEELCETLQILRGGPGGQVPDSAGRTRVSLDTIGNTSLAIPAVTTVTTVARLASLGSSSTVTIPADLVGMATINGPASDLYRGIAVQ
ncbi:hypothetical protein [Amycolatopsis sp. NPDC021455]|uniref:hypothetical protein n=1 Tax=Amycolatopsis sp. NPDC021455 TaxID=3154901 RepID=UPI0033F49CA1